MKAFHIEILFCANEKESKSNGEMQMNLENCKSYNVSGAGIS
jgi:hypothetical protein